MCEKAAKDYHKEATYYGNKGELESIINELREFGFLVNIEYDSNSECFLVIWGWAIGASSAQ